MLRGLLLPVAAILVWLHWYLLPNRKWLRSDSLVVMLVLTCAGEFVALAWRRSRRSSG